MIISKYYKKKVLSRQGNSNIRPTTAKVRESVFNIIRSFTMKNSLQIHELSFLDLYCGTGSIGIEAISQGFSYVCFVDKQKKWLKCIEEKLSSIHLNKYSCLNLNAISFVNRYNRIFDVIFYDPPYQQLDHTHVDKIIHYFMKINSLLILEVNKRINYVIPDTCNLITHKKYGHCQLITISKIH